MGGAGIAVSDSASLFRLRHCLSGTRRKLLCTGAGCHAQTGFADKAKAGLYAAPHPYCKAEKPQPADRRPTLRQEAIGMRPVAVVVGNSQASLPQYGISEADLVFELPVEGGVTRFLTLYGDYTRRSEICSIRSCRYYFPVLAAGFDAYFVHWGQDETLTADVLSYLELDRLDGASDRSGLFSRIKPA